MACNAGIIPQVFGGKSLPLDHGHEQRLFTKTQNAKRWRTVTAAAPSPNATGHPNGAKHTTGGPDGPTAPRPDSTTAS